MKIYIEFYRKNKSSYSEVVGDRGIILIDGRLSLFNQQSVAFDECLKRGFDGYQVLQGDNLLSARPIGNFVKIGEKQ